MRTPTGDGCASFENVDVAYIPDQHPLPTEETLRLLEEGRTFEEIAQIRERTLQSVVALVAEMIERGDSAFQPEWLAPDRYDQIVTACHQLGMDRLKPLKDALPTEATYEQIRLVVSYLRRKTSAANS